MTERRSSRRSWRRGFRIDRRAVELGSALVPDAYPAPALAQLGSRSQKIAREFVGGLARAGGVLERHSAGIEHDVAIVEQIEIKQRHGLGTPSERTRLRTSDPRRWGIYNHAPHAALPPNEGYARRMRSTRWVRRSRNQNASRLPLPLAGEVDALAERGV